MGTGKRILEIQNSNHTRKNNNHRKVILTILEGQDELDPDDEQIVIKLEKYQHTQYSTWYKGIVEEYQKEVQIKNEQRFIKRLLANQYRKKQLSNNLLYLVLEWLTGKRTEETILQEWIFGSPEQIEFENKWSEKKY